MKVIYNNKEVANTTLNYNELFNKPLLNSHELVGNTSLNDIGVYSKPQVDNLIASTRSIKVVSALPTPLVANTMYYVGPDQNNLYHIYLVDSSLTLIDLGMSQDAVYIGGNGIDISSDNEISVVFDNETLMLNSEGELYVRPATQNVEGVVSYDNTTIKKNNSGKIYVPQLEGTKGSNTNPVYLNNGQITASTGTVGSTDRPVYLNAGTITQTSTPESGSWYKGVPLVSNSGVTEIGNYLDFHNSNTTTKDFNVRLYADMNAQTGLAIMGVKDDGTDLTGGYIPVVTNNWEDVGSAIQPVYVNNGALTKTQSLFTTDGATNIPANSNLNTTAFTAVGKYVCGSNTAASTLTNCPSTAGFNMIVENAVGTDSVSLSNIGGWVSRTRTIESFGGDKWVQSITKDGASDTTISYGAWRRLVYSDYINKYAPFTISNSLDGSKTNRTVTLLNGKTVTAEANINNRGVFLSGTGIASAVRVHQTMYILTDNVKTNNDIVVGYLLENSSASLTLNGTVGSTVVNYSQANNLGSSTSTIFKPFTADSNITQFHVDIDWLRASDTTANWWSGYGTITLSGSSGVITRASLTLICRANSPSVLPFIQLTAQSTQARAVYYSFDIYQPSF